MFSEVAEINPYFYSASCDYILQSIATSYSLVFPALGPRRSHVFTLNPYWLSFPFPFALIGR